MDSAESQMATMFSGDLVEYLRHRFSVLALVVKNPYEIHKMKLNVLALTLATMEAATDEIRKLSGE